MITLWGRRNSMNVQKVVWAVEELGIGSSSFTRNGWESPGALWSILAVLVSVILAGVIIASRIFNANLPALPQLNLVAIADLAYRESVAYPK